VPQITVLTHGWMGGARDWSNDYYGEVGNHFSDNFADDPASLINKLSEKAGGATVFWAKMNPDNKSDFALYDISNQLMSRSVYSQADQRYYLEPQHVKKHIIVIFESGNNEDFNENVYFELNTVLSRIVFDVKKLNGGVLPKINLIGHSRGAVTNMQYALDHPDLVTSLISIGGTYFGATTGNFGEWLFRHMDALDDINNQEKFDSYNYRWNTNFDGFYSKINATAIGSYSSLAFLNECLAKDKSGMFNTAKKAGALGLLNAGFAIATLMPKNQKARSVVTRELEGLLPGSKGDSAAHIALDEIRLEKKNPKFKHLSTVSFYNDGCVHLDSQLARSGALTGVSDYKGFQRLEKYFKALDGTTDFNRVGQPMPPVAHNIVTRDRDIIRMILDSCGIVLGRG